MAPRPKYTVFPVCMLANEPQMNTAELSRRPVMVKQNRRISSVCWGFMGVVRWDFSLWRCRLDLGGWDWWPRRLDVSSGSWVGDLIVLRMLIMDEYIDCEVEVEGKTVVRNTYLIMSCLPVM